MPDTLTPADLLLTKLQIVEINAKDLTWTRPSFLRNCTSSARAARAGQDEVSLDPAGRGDQLDWGTGTPR